MFSHQLHGFEDVGVLAYGDGFFDHDIRNHRCFFGMFAFDKMPQDQSCGDQTYQVAFIIFNRRISYGILIHQVGYELYDIIFLNGKKIRQHKL